MELILPMYNAHPYFSLKNLGKKVHIIHGKIQYIFLSQMLLKTFVALFLSRASRSEHFSRSVEISLAIYVFSQSQIFLFCFVVLVDFGVRALGSSHTSET